MAASNGRGLRQGGGRLPLEKGPALTGGTALSGPQRQFPIFKSRPGEGGAKVMDLEAAQASCKAALAWIPGDRLEIRARQTDRYALGVPASYLRKGAGS